MHDQGRITGRKSPLQCAGLTGYEADRDYVVMAVDRSPSLGFYVGFAVSGYRVMYGRIVLGDRNDSGQLRAQFIGMDLQVAA